MDVIMDMYWLNKARCWDLVPRIPTLRFWMWMELKAKTPSFFRSDQLQQIITRPQMIWTPDSFFGEPLLNVNKDSSSSGPLRHSGAWHDATISASVLFARDALHDMVITNDQGLAVGTWGTETTATAEGLDRFIEHWASLETGSYRLSRELVDLPLIPPGITGPWRF